MLASVDDLIDFDLAPSREALAEMRDAASCALCDAPQLSLNAPAALVFAWLDRFAPDDAVRARAEFESERHALQVGASGGRSGGDLDEPIGWHDFRKTYFADSALSLGYAIPYTVLQVARASFDATLEAFVPDAFLIAVCDRCCERPVSVSTIAERLRATYIKVKSDGNETVARSQPSWPLVERTIALVDAAALLHSNVA